MSYGVYHTDMVVLGTMPSDEASNIITLLTRDLGLIRAKAQSVRKSTSKLRFGLQYLSAGTVDVIRAKDFWRIVGVEGKVTLVPGDIRHTALHRIVQLIVRMVPRDERVTGVYESFVMSAELFVAHTDGEHQNAIELLTVARILEALGYWNDALEIYREQEITSEILVGISADKKRYVTAINAALRDSHL